MEANRELDWKIHTLMGNDLTGWEWDEATDCAILRFLDRLDNQVGFELWKIPHYSTTWEGAGLVMERMSENGIRCEIKINHNGTGKYIVRIYEGLIGSMFEKQYVAVEDSAPLALAKAYISAMEERK